MVLNVFFSFYYRLKKLHLGLKMFISFLCWSSFLLLLCLCFKKKQCKHASTQTEPTVEFVISCKNPKNISSRDKAWKRLYKKKVSEIKAICKEKIDNHFRDYIPDCFSLPEGLAFWDWLELELGKMNLWITDDPAAPRMDVPLLISHTASCFGLINRMH